MDRINHPTATAERTFTGGNLAADIPATVVTPEYMTSLQEEVCNVIEGSGLTLDPEDDTQLNQAIDAKIAYAVRLKDGGGIITTEDGLAVDPSVLDATAQLRYHGLI